MSLIKNRYRTHTEWHTDVFSTTFSASQETDGRKLLITQIHAKWITRPVAEALLQACRRLSTLRHPGLASILDFHFDGRHFFVVYDVPETATPMEVLIRSERGWPPEKHHNIITQILEGLMTLETEGLYHGHLNFMTVWMVDDHPLLVHTLLYDILFCANTKHLSKYNNGIFLAPEQRNSQPGSPLSDMFAVGVMLYILLSHRWPVPYSPNLDTLLKAYQTGTEPFQPIASTPLSMHQFLRTALALTPTHRFKTVAECQRVLGLAIQTKKEVPPPPVIPFTPLEKAKKPVKKLSLRKRLMRSGPLLTLLVIVILYFVYNLYMTSVPIKVVPNIEGLSVSEATEKLEALGLRAQVSGARMSKDIPPGYVLESRPAPGHEVKQNRLILLFIAKALDALQVPDFQGRSWTQALALAADIGIQVFTLEEQYSATVDASYVIHQDSTPNATVSPNIRVGVVLSKGYPVSVSISPSPIGEELRRVSISLKVPNHWSAQTITVQQIQDTQSRTLFSKLAPPSFENTMVYDLPLGSSIQVMYNNRIAGKHELMDTLDDAHSTANASSL